jgi:hypothetical protein
MNVWEYLEARARRRQEMQLVRMELRRLRAKRGSLFNMRDAIGIALIASFIGAIGVLFWKAIPPTNEQLIVYMLGQLSGFVAAVVALHYVMKAGEKELEQQRAANTGKAFDAVAAAAAAVPPPPGDRAAAAAAEVADAAEDQAAEIRNREKS